MKRLQWMKKKKSKAQKKKWKNRRKKRKWMKEYSKTWKKGNKNSMTDMYMSNRVKETNKPYIENNISDYLRIHHEIQFIKTYREAKKLDKKILEHRIWQI